MVLFGSLVPRAISGGPSRATTTGLICAVLSVVPGIALLWLGLPFVSAGAAVALGTEGSRDRRWQGAAATAIGLMVIVLGLALDLQGDVGDLPQDGSAPERAFDKYDAAAFNPCGVPAAFGDVIIGSVSGIDDIGQAAVGVLDPPIVAQNGRYVRTLTLFNQIAFDHIVKNRFFLRAELPRVPRPRPERPVIEFPMGSIAVKSAWIDVTDLPAPLVKRFYTRTALVKRATGAGCARLTVGLIGLHIAQKTPSRPQWIWSSFEQKDAVPPKWADWPGAFALNDGSGAPMPERNPLSLVPLAPEPVRPFNVVRDRDAPILTSTELTSFGYQHLLTGTPWQHYRLVVTQWPRLEGNQAAPIPASQDGSVANTFPGLGAFSAFANVTMETFDQKGVELGCMSCHNRARLTADFMWSVLDHAYPPQLAPAPR